jgi:hypothetical protein
MTISWAKSYIAKNPQFELTSLARPKLQAGEMTIVYECLERFGPRMYLHDLVRRCMENGLKDRFTNSDTDPTLCVLYHLKLLAEGTRNRQKHSERAAIREL